MRTLLSKLLLGLLLSFGAVQAQAYNWFVSCTGFGAGVAYEDTNKIHVNSPIEPISTTFLATNWEAEFNDLDSRTSATCRQQVITFYRGMCSSLTTVQSVTYRVGAEMQGFTGNGYSSYYYRLPWVLEKEIPVADVCPVCRNQGYSWTFQTGPGVSVDPNAAPACGYYGNGNACPVSVVPLSRYSYPLLKYTCQ